jgi:hypothetical protein
VGDDALVPRARATTSHKIPRPAAVCVWRGDELVSLLSVSLARNREESA